MFDGEQKNIYEKLTTDVQKNAIKLQQRNVANSELEDLRYRRREWERELRKSQCEIITIEEGAVVSKTLNLRIDSQPRRVTNFSNPSLTKVVHAENPYEHIYLFRAEIVGKYNEILLLEEKMSKSQYIIKKLAQIGAEFYGTEKQEKNYALKVMRKLIREVADIIWIPEETGWYISGNGQIKFYERGKMTWNQAKELAM